MPRWQVNKDAIDLWRVQQFSYTLLAVTQSVNNLFHSFIVLCENEYFLISNLRRSFTNFTSCPLVLLSFLKEKNIFLPIFSYPFNILKTSILSPLNHLVSRVVKPYSFRRSSELRSLSSGIILVALLCIRLSVSISFL